MADRDKTQTGCPCVPAECEAYLVPAEAEAEAVLPLIKGDKGDPGERGPKGDKGAGLHNGLITRRVIVGRIPKIGAPHNGTLYEAYCRTDEELLLSANTAAVRKFLYGKTESCLIGVSFHYGNVSDVFFSVNPHNDCDTPVSLLDPDNPLGIHAERGDNGIFLTRNANWHGNIQFDGTIWVAWHNSALESGGRYVVGWTNGSIDIIPWGRDMARDTLPKPDGATIVLKTGENGKKRLYPNICDTQILLQIQRKRRSKLRPGGNRARIWSKGRVFDRADGYTLPNCGVFRIRYVTVSGAYLSRPIRFNLCGPRSPWSVFSWCEQGHSLEWLG